MSEAYLAGLLLEGRDCLVIGGDAEAAVRTRRLLETGARVSVVWPTLCDELGELATRGLVDWRRRTPDETDTARCFLAISTPRDAALSAWLYARARGTPGFLLCCLDQTEYCTFTHLAVVRRGPLRIAIGSDGRAPGLVARLRSALEAGLDDAFVSFAERLARARAELAPQDRRLAMDRWLEALVISVGVRLPTTDSTPGPTDESERPLRSS